MPRRSPRGCAQPGCPELAYDGRYCEEHQREREERYDAKRGSAAKRGYGRRWRKLRKMFLNAHPLCADPFGVHAAAGEIVQATQVDHIKPKRAGGRDSWDNLQALCDSCHSRKTALEYGRWG